MNSKRKAFTHGFTIAELLIVIIVIAILITLVAVGYGGFENHARETKMSNDISQLKDAIRVARTKKHETLASITGSYYTAAYCVGFPDGTDLSAVPRTDNCWVKYEAALDAISDASGIDVRSLTDPWGRPYLIDENEYELNNEGQHTCYFDSIAAYTHPYKSGWNFYQLPNQYDVVNLEPSGYTPCTANNNGPTLG